MNVLWNTIALVLIITLTGCWNAKYSPHIYNDTSSELTLTINSKDQSKTFIMPSGDNLLLPNILTEEGFESLGIKTGENVEIVIPKQKMISYIQQKDNANFLVSEYTKSNERIK